MDSKPVGRLSHEFEGQAYGLRLHRSGQTGFNKRRRNFDPGKFRYVVFLIEQPGERLP